MSFTIIAVDRDRALIDLLEAGDRAEQRALAAAAWADQDSEFAFRDIQADAFDGVRIAIIFMQVGDASGWP